MRTSLQSCRWVFLVGWLILQSSGGHVQAINWDGGGMTSEWLEAANWEFDTIPTATDTATIINDTATITEVFVPPVQRLEIGLGSLPGTLNMIGSVNSATLQVLDEVAIGPRGELEVGISSAHLLGASFHNQGDITVATGGQITAFQEYIQADGETRLTGGDINANVMQINDGVLLGNGAIEGDVTLGGFPQMATPTLSPGVGIGQLDIDGDLELGRNAVFHVEIDASGPTIVADLVNVTSSVSLGGTLHLDLVAGSIAAGDRIEILLADNFEPGTYFDDITGLETDNGSLIVVFDPIGGLTSGPSISVYESTELGDMNGDGVVDALDANLFAWAIRDAISYDVQFVESNADVDCILAVSCKAAQFFMADMDGDRRRTFADIPLFLEKVDQSGGNSAAAWLQIVSVLNGTPIPEPATAGLAFAGLGCLFMRNIRRNT